MDPHRLAEERSLEYHRVVAERLADDPTLLERARERVGAWLRQEPPPHHAVAWAEYLSGPLASLQALLIDRGEQAAELRQSTPFAGALDPRERWQLWQAVARRVRDAR
jgi:hypothetical protein